MGSGQTSQGARGGGPGLSKKFHGSVSQGVRGVVPRSPTGSIGSYHKARGSGQASKRLSMSESERAEKCECE